LNFIRSGSPPTLWWVLIVADGPLWETEHGDELGADDLALPLRVGDAGERGQEPILGVDHDEVHVERAAEDRGHVVALSRAEEAVVDEDARQALADRAVHQRRHHR
jgi:hypothetical protein